MSDQNEIAGMLAEQVERLFAKSVTRELLLDVEERDKPATQLWKELEDIGVTLALAGDAAGGAGLSWAEAEPLLRVLGRHAAPVPLGETLVGAWLLSAAGLAVPPGALTLAGSLFSLNADGSLAGSEALLPWGAQAGHVIVAAQRGDERYLALVSTQDAQCTPQRSYARIPSVALTLAGAKPLQLARLDSLGELGLLPYLAALRSVQTAGLLDRTLELAIEYANTRVQFGKPIGKFQAIQHLLAELAGHVAAAQVAGLYACRRIDAGAAEQGAAVAKVRSGLSATRAAAIAHQVFGAIGVTDEHILHYYTRRLWQWRGEAGSDHFWSERLGRAVIAAGAAALWPSISDRYAQA